MAEPTGGEVREWAVDLLLATAVAALAVSSVFAADPSSGAGARTPDGRLVALLLISSLALALRRRFPVAVLAVVLLCVAGIAAGRWSTEAVAGCLLFAVYSIAAWRGQRVAAAGLAATFLVMLGLVIAEVPYFDSPAAIGNFVAFGLVWGLGSSVRRWRESRAEALDRAVEAERSRAVAAERAVFAERLRIARELHDVVSHTLSVIAVQSGVARHLLGPDGGPATSALTVIEESSRDALDDLRRVLGVLRADGGDPPMSLTPSPGLADLRLLASAHRAAGGPVRTEIDDELGDLPESVRVTVFRIVQEALTNVRKHAPGAAARIVVRRRGSTVEVVVTDDGPGLPAAGEGQGFGLRGIRERAAMFGGTVEAGAVPGGFRVGVVLHTDTGRVLA